MSIIEITNIIKRYIGDIEKLKTNIKAQKEMYVDSFENDAKYSESAEKAKQASRELQAIKQIITKQPAVEASAAKLREFKDELKDIQDALSGYLQEYQRISGTNVIEGDDGTLRQIVHIFKLIKKSSKDA